jgi:hypothetical protein
VRRLAALAAGLAVAGALTMPAAPAAATVGRCAGAVHAARVAAGLPARFDYLAWRESRCNPRAVSRTHDYGAWQIHAPGTVAWCRHRIGPGNPLALGWNARCAAALFHRFGYRPWAV